MYKPGNECSKRLLTNFVKWRPRQPRATTNPCFVSSIVSNSSIFAESNTIVTMPSDKSSSPFTRAYPLTATLVVNKRPFVVSVHHRAHHLWNRTYPIHHRCQQTHRHLSHLVLLQEANVSTPPPSRSSHTDIAVIERGSLLTPQ
ncbi:unnamed protein product [Heligmosomoides polygyrus]|uniref:Uncharacterized protein n=1 Tax=Heligmosomoides polygyrus TaxID=6339 RepID=A0A183FDD1_HELPZ|nr:unnamed protein product [Heligmosomoides polygyrus]